MMFDDFDYDGATSFDGIEDFEEPLGNVGDSFVSYGSEQSGVFGNTPNMFGGNVFDDNTMFTQDVVANNIFGDVNTPEAGFSDSSMPNIFGGQDIIEDGVRVASTQPNIFGGANLFEDGVATATTMTNIFGGQDIIEDGVRVASTQPNIFGGVNLVEDGVVTATTVPNIFGGQDIFENGVRIGNTIPNIFGKK